MLKSRVVTNFCKNIAYNIHTSCVLSIDHYSVLEVHRKSTQSEIKAAYYKLSKIYHPDLNNNPGAEKKFREITEAYEVLGNIRLKKLYDKGVIQHYDPYEATEEETVEDKFYKSRDKKTKVPNYGKTTIYDFDQWTKVHYSNTFSRARFDRDRRYKSRENVNHTKNELAHSKFVMACIFSIYLVSFLYSNVYKNDDPDNPTKR